MDNELFVLIRALEERSGAETEPGNAGVHLPSGRVCDDADSFLDSILTSQAYRALAEQRLEKGLTQEAAKCFEEAYEQGSDCLPRRWGPGNEFCPSFDYGGGRSLLVTDRRTVNQCLVACFSVVTY